MKESRIRSYCCRNIDQVGLLSHSISTQHLIKVVCSISQSSFSTSSTMSLVRKLFLILSTTGIGCIAYFGYLCPIKNNLEDNPNHSHEKQSGQLQDFFVLADVASSNRRLSTISKNSHIRIFDLKSYENALKSHPIQQNLCVLKHLFKVRFKMKTTG